MFAKVVALTNKVLVEQLLNRDDAESFKLLTQTLERFVQPNSITNRRRVKLPETAEEFSQRFDARTCFFDKNVFNQLKIKLQEVGLNDRKVLQKFQEKARENLEKDNGLKMKYFIAIWKEMIEAYISQKDKLERADLVSLQISIIDGVVGTFSRLGVGVKKNIDSDEELETEASGASLEDRKTALDRNFMAFSTEVTSRDLESKEDMNDWLLARLSMLRDLKIIAKIFVRDLPQDENIKVVKNISKPLGKIIQKFTLKEVAEQIQSYLMLLKSILPETNESNLDEVEVDLDEHLPLENALSDLNKSIESGGVPQIRLSLDRSISQCRRFREGGMQ